MFALHPGWVWSRHDGDRHYIGAAQLARLYKVPMHEAVVWTDERGRRWSDYTHLYPRYDGRYELPENSSPDSS